LELVKNVGLIAAVAAIALLAPARTQPATEVTVKLSDLPPVVVNLTTETAPVNVTIPEQPAPVINLTVPKSEPSTVIVEPAPVLPAQVIYRRPGGRTDREGSCVSGLCGPAPFRPC
jgi:hypothetical protein